MTRRGTPTEHARLSQVSRQFDEERRAMLAWRREALGESRRRRRLVAALCAADQPLFAAIDPSQTLETWDGMRQDTKKPPRRWNAWGQATSRKGDNH